MTLIGIEKQEGDDMMHIRTLGREKRMMVAQAGSGTIVIGGKLACELGVLTGGNPLECKANL